MTAHTSLPAAELRRQLDHPIIDADGHVIELLPAVCPYLREALGAEGFERYRKQGPATRRSLPTPSQASVLADRSPQPAWWAAVTDNALDRATVMFPALLAERSEEIGIDFSVLYTSCALSSCAIEEEHLRRGVARGFNAYYADVYGPHRDRLAVAGLIPMHTPEEAIDEIEHCADLGLRVIGLPEGVMRPIEAGPSQHPHLWPGQAHWFDTFGLDSAHDYDPVWRRARELGFAITFHGALGTRPGVMTSPTSYVYNHLGMFSSFVAPVCKSLFMGGVTRRFPELPFAFLECGVSWGTQLLCDLVEHWERRNLDALAHLDPARLSTGELEPFFERYGGALRDRLEGSFGEALHSIPLDGCEPEELDEWKHLGVSSASELVESFASSFYFGCESEDRGIRTAFPPLPPLGARLNAMFSSDLGHWDVTDATTVVPDAWSLVEESLLSKEEFRQFTFTNPARLFTAVAPEFFAGTPIEADVQRLLETDH